MVVKMSVQRNTDADGERRGQSWCKKQAEPDCPRRSLLNGERVGSLAFRDVMHRRPIQAKGLCHFANLFARGVRFRIGNSVFAKFHFVSPMRSRMIASARYKCDFTVLRFIPIVVAISSSSISSTNRSTKTVR